MKTSPSYVAIMRLNTDNKLFLLVFAITLTVFVFTNDGHRYTIDEDVAQKQSMNIVIQKPQPGYVQGESRILFEYPEYFPANDRPICQNGILCSQAPIGHSLTQVPFILINQNFHIITTDIVFTSEDFDDPHYVWWRNTLEPDFTFLELFYGPVFSALSVGTFFLLCRTFDYTRKTSIILALLYGMATTIWAYSETSLNVVPATFFVLLGILFFRRFQKNQSHTNLIFCGTSIGFAFLTRYDVVLFIIPLFLFLLYDMRKKNEKVKKFLAFVVPAALSYGIYQIINLVRVGSSNISASSIGGDGVIHVGIFGLLLSPGVGLLIFAPILFTIFFAFPDFYKRNKQECILFLSFIVLFLGWYGTSPFWHGLNAWGARYLLMVVPFLLLPLGTSIEKRKSKVIKTSILILAAAGVFFNLVYLVQDVAWFVWGKMTTENEQGLYALGKYGKGLWIHPLTLWTFEYSQLTHSIIWAFEHLQPDIFLLKVLEPQVFAPLFVTLLTPPVYLLLRLLQEKSIITKQQDETLC
ncbi:MAG: ArnT family glycosyltransferase [Nitrosopumilaceae archaeon]